MPKKTKRQKILAELRRKSDFVKSPKKEIHSYSLPATNGSFILEKNAGTEPNIVKNEADYSYVKQDLIKITIFTIFALGAQGVLYFVLHRG